ncbi:MAG: PepSY domain-containing protein [Thiohalocapsa sp.]|jgi:uncharacterized membrane protein YkoI|nr:PepSY domain-containing protein [Thiohalocapsa sp.]MCF7989740.1 PepSY domain-containing protein [Thiohalocapsa sp.]
MQFSQSNRALTLSLALLVPALPAVADDHDLAREALQRGEVRPIAEILSSVDAQVNGDIIEVELEREDGRLVYELKVIESDGRVSEILVDAASAEVLSRKYD